MSIQRKIRRTFKAGHPTEASKLHLPKSMVRFLSICAQFQESAGSDYDQMVNPWRAIIADEIADRKAAGRESTPLAVMAAIIMQPQVQAMPRIIPEILCAGRDLALEHDPIIQQAMSGKLDMAVARTVNDDLTRLDTIIEGTRRLGRIIVPSNWTPRKKK
jgi:hypothetical protein